MYHQPLTLNKSLFNIFILLICAIAVTFATVLMNAVHLLLH